MRVIRQAAAVKPARKCSTWNNLPALGRNTAHAAENGGDSSCLRAVWRFPGKNGCRTLRGNRVAEDFRESAAHLPEDACGGVLPGKARLPQAARGACAARRRGVWHAVLCGRGLAGRIPDTKTEPLRRRAYQRGRTGKTGAKCSTWNNEKYGRTFKTGKKYVILRKQCGKTTQL